MEFTEKTIKQWIDERFRLGFGKRIGDTPTEAYQLVPKKYVDARRSYGAVVDLTGAGTVLPTGWSSTKVTDGQWRVTHNLNTTNYAVTLTIVRASPVVSQIQIFLLTGEQTAVDFEYAAEVPGSGGVNVTTHITVALA